MITGFMFKPSSSDLHLTYAFADLSASLRLPKKMRSLKRFFRNKYTHHAKPTLQHEYEAANSHIPHLVRKKRQKKRKNNASVPTRPFTRAFVLEEFSNPALPRVILHPPTPADNKFNLEDFLFERCGSVFVLRDPLPRPESRAASATATATTADWWATDYLQVPPAYKEVELDADDITETVDVEKGLLELGLLEKEEEVHSVYLDEDCEADYRAYMDGLIELI